MADKKRTYGSVYDALNKISEEEGIDFGLGGYSQDDFKKKYFTGPGNISNLYNKLSKISDEEGVDFGLGTQDEWLASFGYRKKADNSFETLDGKRVGGKPKPSFQTTINNAEQTLAENEQVLRRIHNREQRIGLDLPQEPIRLGKNRKVTKGRQRFDITTGQMEPTYITESGNEYENRALADLEQNAEDQAEWDKNHPKEALKSNINRQISELEGKIAEMKGPGGAPQNTFTNMYSGSVGAPVRQTDYDKKLSDLEIALKDLKDAQTRMERSEQLHTSSDFLGGIGIPFTSDWYNNWKNFGYGIWDTLSDPGLYDLGITDIAKAGKYSRIKQKIENGEELSEQETALALAGMAKAQAEQLATVPHGYTAGVTTTEMVPFMIQMAMNPGSGIGRSLARKAVRQYGRDGVKAVTARVMARALGNMGEAAVLSNTLQAGKTIADIMQRYNGDTFQYDDDGNLKIGYYEEGPDGEPHFVEGGKSLLRSVYEGEAASIIENFTELGLGGNLGGMVSKTLGSKLGEKMGLGYISNLMSKVGSTPFAKAMKRFKQVTHWDGMIEEPLEEEYGIILNSILQTGDAKISDLWDSEKQADIFAGTMWFGGMLGGMNMAAYPIYRHNIKKQLDIADQNGQVAFGQDWQAMKDTIDMMDDKDIGSYLYNIKDNKDLSNEQKAAVFGYATRLKQHQGAEVAEMLSRMEGNLSEDNSSIHSAYDTGAEAENPDEMKQYADEAKAAEEILPQYGDEFAKMITEGAADPVATMNYLMQNRDLYTDEQIAAAADYYQKQARADGMMDGVIDRIDLEVEKANAEVRANTHRDTGQIINATIGGEDYFVIGGDVTTDDDGLIQVNGTGGAVIVKNAETGEVSVKSAASVTPYQITDANDLINYNENTLRQQLMQQADDDMNYGNPANEVFDREDTVTLQDGQGGLIEGMIVNLPNSFDGVFEVQTTDNKVLQMTADDLNRRIVAHNGQEVQRASTIAEQQEIIENEEGISLNDTNNVQNYAQNSPEIIPEEPQVYDNQENGEGQINSQEQPQSAIERIPVKTDAEGNPILNRKGQPTYEWHKASVEDVTEALLETTGGNRLMARDTATDLVNVAKGKLEKIRKQKPKGEDPFEIAESRKAKQQAEEEQQAIIKHWQNVSQQIQRMMEVESAERLAAAEAAKSEEQRVQEAERARIIKQKQDEIDRQRLREQIEKDRKNRTKEYDPLVKARQEMNGYDEALGILSDTEPRSLEEWVSSLLRPHSLLWQDASDSERGLQSELGLKRADMQRMMSLLGTKENGAKPFGAAVLEIHEGLPEGMKEQYTDEDVRNTLLELFNEGNSTRMLHLTEEHRIEEARESMREADRRAEEAEMEAWAEAYHLTPEERDQFEAYLKMPPSEPEQKIIDQIIAEDEQNRASIQVDSQHPDRTVGGESEGSQGKVQNQGAEAQVIPDSDQQNAESRETDTDITSVSGNNVPGRAQEREALKILFDQTGVEDVTLADRMSDSEVDQLSTLLDEWDIVNSDYGQVIEEQSDALKDKDKKVREAAQAIVDEAEQRSLTAFDPIQQYIEEMTVKYEGALPSSEVDHERMKAIREELTEAYRSGDATAIANAVENAKAYVDDGLDDYRTYDESVDDYDGKEPEKLADQYITHLYQDRYLDDDEDQEYIRTGLKTWMREDQPVGETSSLEEIAAEEQKVDTNPTDAQKEAGNYQKGHIKVDGFDVTIENPKGSIRSGVDAKGNKWETTMNNTYGYIRGTEGVDGDHIDVFLSDNPSEGKVYVVDQVNPETGAFDEHKVMYGFNDVTDAKIAYFKNYAKGWKGFGDITEVSRDDFKKWIESSHRKTKPFRDYAIAKKTDELKTEINGKTFEFNKNGVCINPNVIENKKGKIRYKISTAYTKKGWTGSVDVNSSMWGYGGTVTANDNDEFFNTEQKCQAFCAKRIINMLARHGEEKPSDVSFLVKSLKDIIDKATPVAPSEQIKPTDLRDAVRPESAEIGVNEANARARELSDNEVEEIVNSMKAHASVVPVVEITEENWQDNVDTPIGNVKMGENQKEKMFVKGREQQYGMLLETLRNPDIVIEEQDKEQNMFHERPSSYIFVKTFIKLDGTKYVHFESVTVSQDGMEVSVSSHIIRENQLKNKLKSDRLLYKATALDEPAISSAGQPTNIGGSQSSEDKGTNNSANKQENSEKSFVENLKKLINDYDTGDNGYLTERDFIEQARSLTEELPQDSDIAKKLNNAFAEYDDMQYAYRYENGMRDDDGADAMIEALRAVIQAKKEPKRLVSDDRMEELKKRLKSKLGGQLNVGVDPEIVAIGAEIAVGYIERGVTKFADFAKAIIEEVGDFMRPYLKSFYNSVRDMPEAASYAKDMDDYQTVDKFDVFNFDKKKQPTVIEKAEQVNKEHKVRQQTKKIKKEQPDLFAGMLFDEEFTASEQQTEQPQTPWWNDPNRPKSITPKDYRTYTTDEAKAYFAQFKSEDGKRDFTKWSHPELAYITAAAWDGANIPVSELMAIPAIAEAEKRVKAKNELPIFRIDEKDSKELADRLSDKEHGSSVMENGKIKKVNGKEYFSGPVRQERKAFIVIGRPAGGKSSVFANALSYDNGARIIDSDTVKPWLSGYDDGYGAGYVQKASAIVANIATTKAIENGDNIILPRIGGDSIMEDIMILRQNGYEVSLYFNDVSEETSIMRAASRFAESGRYLSLDYLTKIHDKSLKTFCTFVQKKIGDYYAENQEIIRIDEGTPKRIPVLGERVHNDEELQQDGRGAGEGLPELVSDGRGTVVPEQGGQQETGRTLGDELIFSYAEWKSNDVPFGEKPKEVWNSESGKGLPLTGNIKSRLDKEIKRQEAKQNKQNGNQQTLSAEPRRSGEGKGQEGRGPERTGAELGTEQNRTERSGRGRAIEKQQPTTPKQAPKNNNTRNNHGERGKDYAPTSPKARFNANVEAIKLVRQLMDEGIEAPTKEQMEVLRKYSGWGGLGTFFNDATTPEYRTLQDLLSEEEFRDAAMSINSAYYTPAIVIDTLWDIADAMGFKGGNMLEGSAGIGNIIGQMPAEMSRQSNIEAVEIDAISGNILKLLYPDAKVHIQGFQDTVIRNGSVDLAITNVPFVTGLHVIDKVDKDLSRKFTNIHDFCIAKNIRKLKEGGIGIFITSSGTLDKSTKLREWITDEGQTDVVGAFRLNNQTFGGTNVTSDIIVVRKRVNGQKLPMAIDISKASPMRVGSWKDKTGTSHQVSMTVNDYFKVHPEMMAGKMYFGYEKGETFRPGSYGLYPEDAFGQSERLANFVEQMRNVGVSIAQRNEEPVKEKEPESLQLTAEKEGRMLINDKGELCVSRLGTAVPLGLNGQKVKGQTKQQCFKDYQAVQKAVDELLQQELSSADDEALKPKLANLNKAFDTFIKRYGSLHKNTAISFLRNDIDFPSFLALEDYSETKDINGKVKVETSKPPIFSKRVLGFKTEPQPKTVKDAVTASMFRNNSIDLEWIAEKLGKNTEEVKKEILDSRLAFDDPSTGTLEIRYKYLSGNVREKLAIAEEYNKMSETAGRYDSNVEELRKAVPMDIPAHLIDFSLGSSWIPKELYMDYLKEVYDLHNVRLTHVEGSWIFDEGYSFRNEKNRAAGVYSEQFRETIYGHQLVAAAMNNRPIKVAKQVTEGWGENKTKKTVVDKNATQACAVRVDEIKDDFKQWAKKRMQDDPEIGQRIEKIYNEKFNALVPMTIDKEFMPDKFEGANIDISLYDHQKTGVMRGLTAPTMLAHEVGTGKSFTLITTAMEMRRIGTARKPMVVVQNATVAQITNDAKLLYPNAKILSLSEKDRTAEGRRAFYAKIKYNDWDIIIVPQSTFERIPDSPERELQFIQEKIDEKKHIIEAAEASGMDTRELRRLKKELEGLENEYGDKYLSSDPSNGSEGNKRKKKDAKKEAAALDKAETRAKEMLDRTTDDVQYFDDLGVDALLVDEAHEYKHLGFQTSMGRGIKGIDPSYSKKCAGLYNKTRCVFEKAGWKNVVFATGTPISNTAAEIWTFMKYLMPEDVMRANDIYYFDDFVRNFGSISQMLEFTTSGKFKENTRFAAYVNKPELIRIWSMVADTVLTSEVGKVKEKIPEEEGGKDQDMFLPQSPSLVSIMAAVRAELERYENMDGKEKKENSYIPLTMYGIAKRAAIDPRLVNPDAADEPMSKTNAAVKEILKDLKATDSYKGTVAVFCDNQNRLNDDKAVDFNIFEEMRDKLIKKGVAPNQIAIIRSGMTVTAKQAKFDEINAGTIRVVMGSTQTLGTGVNIQERLHLLIHMDAPDRPMDYTQRNGRILRQGNLHKNWGKTIRVIRFGVEDSLDVTAYQRLKTKSGFINSIMDGKQALTNNQVDRTVEEEEEGLFDNPVAVLSGSQYAMKKNQAERELRKYQGKKSQWEADQIYVANALRHNKTEVTSTEENIKSEKEQLAHIRSLFPDGKVKTITVEGVEVDMSKDEKKAYGQLSTVIKEKINDPVNAIVKRNRENPIYNDETMPFTIALDGHDVKFNVYVTRTSEWDSNTNKMRYVIHKNTTYNSPDLNIQLKEGSTKSVRDLLDEILEQVVTGQDYQDRINAMQQKIERIKNETAQLQQRVGMEFQYGKELEEAKKRVEEYTELMKQEMKEKEAKYATQQTEAVDLTKAEENGDDDILARSVEQFADGETFPIYETEGYNVNVLHKSRLYSTDLMPDGYPTEQSLLDALRNMYPEYYVSIEDQNVRMERWESVMRNAETAKNVNHKGTESYIERKTRRAINAVENLANKMHLDVEVMTDTEGLKGKKARSKGWFNTKTGKIVIVLPNHTNQSDVINTLLHEGVAHFGLRKMFGRNFETFLNNVYNNVDEAVRARIDAAMKRNGWSRQVATEEYLARLAERTDFDNAFTQGWWNKIKVFFMDMLTKAGFSTTLTDNELRYILWRSYDNLVHPDGRRNIFDKAKEVVMQSRLGINRSALIPASAVQQRAVQYAADTVNEEMLNRDMESIPSQELLLSLSQKDEYERNETINELVRRIREGDARIVRLGEKMELGRTSDAHIAGTIIGGWELGLSPLADGTLRGMVQGRPEMVRGPKTQSQNPTSDSELPIISWAKATGHFFSEEQVRNQSLNKDVWHTGGESRVYRTSDGKKVIKFMEAWVYYKNPLLKRLDDIALQNAVGFEPLTVLGYALEDGHLMIVLEQNYVDGVTVDDIFDDEPITRVNDYLDVYMEEMLGLERHIDDDGNLFHTKNGLVYKDIHGGNVIVDKNNNQHVIDCYVSREDDDQKERAEGFFIEDNENILHRDDDDWIDDIARQTYEKAVAKKTLALQEAWQDSMVSLKAIQDAIAEETGKKATAAEDAYHFENRMHGRAKNMTERYDWQYYLPMLKAFNDFCKEKGLSFEQGQEYLIAKHGLERNVYYAFRDAVKEKLTEEVKEKRKDLEKEYSKKLISEAEYWNRRADIDRLEQDGLDERMKQVRETLAYQKAKEDYEKGDISYTECLRRQESVIRSHAPLYNKYAKDYSGLTETFAKEWYDDAQDIKRHAQRAVDPKERRILWSEYDKAMKQAYDTARQLADDLVFSAEKDRNPQKLWDAINAATEETLKHSYESGLMDRNTYNKVRAMFDYYVPLRGWEEDKASDVYTYMGKENVFSPAVKKTWGRTSRAENPLAYIGNIAVSTILSGHRNQMKQHFLNYVMNNPTSLVSISETWYENIGSPENPIWILRSADTAGKDSDEIAQIISDFNEEMAQKQRVGLAIPVRGRLRLDVNATKGQKAEHVVEVQRAGRTYELYINGNPKAAQALNGTAARAVSRISNTYFGRQISSLNRNMAMFFTSKNPAFVISNLSRDLNMAGASVAVNEGAAYNARFVSNVMKVLAPRIGKSSKWMPSSKQPTGLMPDLMRKWMDGTLNERNETERLFNEFMNEGGETGFVNMLSIDSFKEKMKKEISEMNGSSLFGSKAKVKESSVVKALRLLGETFEFYNRCAEDATRFIVYMTSRQTGKSLEESIADAKDVTLNFNRKGTGDKGNAEIRDLFIFVNPAIQALANMYRMAKKHPLKFGAVTTGFVVVGILMPIINQWLINMMGDDDDKDAYWNLPPWIRKNNLIFWIPGTKNFVTIPLAQEFRVFYGAGEAISSVAMNHPHNNMGLEIVESVADLLPINPTGNGGDLLVDFSPTGSQPLVQVARNTDFTGKPIWKDNQGNKYDPMFTKAYYSTPQWMTKISDVINRATGGDQDSRGWLERTKTGSYLNNPAVWNHLLQGYFGGMYNTVAKTFDVAVTAAQGEMPKVYQTPILNRFLNRPVERDNAGALGEEYWKTVNDAEEMMHIIRKKRQRAADGNQEAQKELEELLNTDNAKRAEVVCYYKGVIDELRKGERAATEKEDKQLFKKSIGMYRQQMFDELQAINGGEEPLEAAMVQFDRTSNPAERKKLQNRIQRLMEENGSHTKGLKADIEKARRYVTDEEEDKSSEERYVSLATASDIRDDARISAAKKKAKAYADRYKELNDAGKTDEAAKYRKDNEKWLSLYNILQRQSRLMSRNKKMLGKGSDKAIMRLLSSNRKSMIQAIENSEYLAETKKE